MNNKLTKEEVLHVAHLARIKIDEEEIEKYQVELKQILDEVEKINDVKGYDEERMIAPWEEDADLRDDDNIFMTDSKEILKNVPKVNGNYIEVPVVIGD